MLVSAKLTYPPVEEEKVVFLPEKHHLPYHYLQVLQDS